MSTTNSKKSTTSSIDYSVYVDQQLIVVDCTEHSQKEGMFITKFTSKLNPNPIRPLVLFGFDQFEQGQIVTMYQNAKGYYTLSPIVDISLYQQLNDSVVEYNNQIESLMSLC